MVDRLDKAGFIASGLLVLQLQIACELAEEMLRQHDLPTISLSVGVATYPDDAQTAADLIEAADQAMYVVKHSGGNQSHAYSQDLLIRRTN